MLYTVKKGDTVSQLSQKYGIPVSVIIAVNGLDKPDQLSVGQSLVLPQPSKIHTVHKGDTPRTIAKKHKISVDRLLRNNPQVGDHALLKEGDSVIIAYGSDECGADLIVNGFSLPFSDSNDYRSALPYLTHVTPFTYGVRANGKLEGMEDEAILRKSLNNGIKPVMNLSSLNTDGSFDNALVHLLLGNREYLDQLIQSVLETMLLKGYRAVLVDFQFLFSEYRQSFTEFIKSLKNALAPYGLEVWVSLAPRFNEHDSLLQEGQDYSALGEIADKIHLLTYEWGYTFEDSLAVSPIDRVKTALLNALEEIDPEKIILGIPTYGKDLAQTVGIPPQYLSNQEILSLAYQNHATIEFDERSISPYFTYRKGDGTHQVFFEDARSLSHKLAMVKEFGLAGISFWNLNDSPLLIQSYFLSCQ